MVDEQNNSNEPISEPNEKSSAPLDSPENSAVQLNQQADRSADVKSPMAEVVAMNQPKTNPLPATPPPSSTPPVSHKSDATASSVPKIPVINKPAPSSDAVVPASGGPKPETSLKNADKHSKKSPARFLWILGLSLVGLFVVFVVLMVLVIVTGGEQGNILSAFGVDAADLKAFLLSIINIAFGLLAFLFFIVSVVGLFRLLMAKKDDKIAKKKE
ncbi:hypothetical protein IPJ72_02320 [Candidatus Peregrinibacteria bacterium]|nr:MAG: hypothetical protein IPJ72_02320 [Candidatus Peregrinibacteria bacterium]